MRITLAFVFMLFTGLYAGGAQAQSCCRTGWDSCSRSCSAQFNACNVGTSGSQSAKDHCRRQYNSCDSQCRRQHCQCSR